MSSTLIPEGSPSELPLVDKQVKGLPLVWVLGASCLYAGLLFVASHWPYETLPWKEFARHHDKWLHVGSFAVLATLIGWSINALCDSPCAGRIKRLCRSPIFVFGMMALYGLLDEITQTLSHRQFDWLDWVADLVGAGLGFAFVLVVRHFYLGRVAAPVAPNR